MKEVLIVILLVIIVPSVQNLQLYTLFTRIVIQNPIYHRVGFFNDLSSLLIYDQTSPSVFEINGYNYTLKDQWQLQNSANALDFFTDVTTLNNIIYSTQTELRQRTFKFNGLKYVDNQLTVMENIQEIDVSSDSFYYAFFCQDGSKLYIGNTSVIVSPQSLSMRDYSDRGFISSIVWKPSNHQMIVTGGRQSDNSTFAQLYDYDLDKALDLTNMTKQIILDSSFNNFGDKFYFIEQNNQRIVKVYDLPSRTLSELVFDTANQLSSISIRGHFLAASDGIEVAVVNLVSGENYGTYESIAQGNALSPDGSDLITLKNSSTLTIDIYKLCIAGRSYFNQLTDQCETCSETCNQCYFQSNRCSSCYDQFYLSNRQCLLCSDAIIGCVSCISSSLCLKCNEAQHRINRFDGKCECESGYFEDAKACLSCMAGCSLCSSAAICDKCDETRHWNRSDSKCICSIGYIEAEDSCKSCQTFLPGCLTCKSTKSCLTCKEGSTLNIQKSQCETDSSSNTLLIVLISVGSVLVLAGLFILFLKIRRGKKKDTLLESNTTGQQRIDS